MSHKFLPKSNIARLCFSLPVWSSCYILSLFVTDIRQSMKCFTKTFERVSLFRLRVDLRLRKCFTKLEAGSLPKSSHKNLEQFWTNFYKIKWLKNWSTILRNKLDRLRRYHPSPSIASIMIGKLGLYSQHIIFLINY